MGAPVIYQYLQYACYSSFLAAKLFSLAYSWILSSISCCSVALFLDIVISSSLCLLPFLFQQYLPVPLIQMQLAFTFLIQPVILSTMQHLLLYLLSAHCSTTVWRAGGSELCYLINIVLICLGMGTVLWLTGVVNILFSIWYNCVVADEKNDQESQ